MNTFTRIPARSCELLDISHRRYSSLVKEFLAENHLQGAVRGISATFGLFYKGELVQLMGFGKPRFNRDFQWEIIRECSKRNVQVIGGSSRLFSAFNRKYSPLSVIVYTSLRDEHLFPTAFHYQKHLNFRSYRKSSLGSEQYYRSRSWPRADSHGLEYSASAVQHIGPDRLLGANFGFGEGSNQELMEKLGYELLTRDTVKPAVDGWIKDSVESQQPSDALGYVYRVDCSCGGVYFGMSERLDPHTKEHYKGSGTLWVRHLRLHPTHSTVKKILRYFDDSEELRKTEERLISIGLQLFKGSIYNTKITPQGQSCSECGRFGRHEKTCSKFVAPGTFSTPCEECAGRAGHHFKNCSSFLSREANPCSECGNVRSHKSSCSKKKVCPECGAGNLGAHRKTCSFYAPVEPCALCGGSVQHKKVCPLFAERSGCSECGSKSRHKRTCSHYKTPKTCFECGASGNHALHCSQYARKACEHCGSPSAHRKNCPLYKRPSGCSECRAIGVHFKSCSHYKASSPCEECGGLEGKHRGSCSRRKSFSRENV